MDELNLLITEQNNKNTQNIDKLDTLSMLTLINHEDANVIDAVARELPNIAKAVDVITAAFKQGGRLLYFGAGTSGRLGVLDASECPPTFGTDPRMVQGFIAGGDIALRNPVEGAEDDFNAGEKLINELLVTSNDVVCGIAASGRTKFVLGAISAAKVKMAHTIGICNNEKTLLHSICDITIAPVSGAEVIEGSTRLKSGTAQKLVLNMLTTASMIKLGKVYKNYMVDMRPSNEKLKARAIRLTQEICNCTKEVAIAALEECEYHVKSAVIILEGEN